MLQRNRKKTLSRRLRNCSPIPLPLMVSMMFMCIHEVHVYSNVVDRPNRYDLMICIIMKKDFLPTYDSSEPHLEWKEKYGKFVENKAIFDSEA